jgi:hypothetical protein
MRAMAGRHWVAAALGLLLGCGDSGGGADSVDGGGDAAEVGDADVGEAGDAHDASDAGDAEDASGDIDGALDTEDAGSDVLDGAGLLGCNGFEALCDRPYDQVVFAATHNAMSNADQGWVPPNQEHPILRQLDDGVRALLIDTHLWKGEPYLCHSICELGNQRLDAAMAELAGWIEANPREVVTLLIQDGISADLTAAVFEEVGLTARVYAHPEGTAWPTLQEMIDADTRLVVTAESGGPPPAWYHHLWDLASDTPYSFDSAEAFSCEEYRGSADNDLFLLNHWLSTPLSLPENAAQVNTFEVLHGRATLCAAERGRLPNFVAVDFYATGDLFEVVRALNGLDP